MNENIKVGVMTLVTLSLLIFMVFKIGDLSLTEKGYEFTISYYNCTGLSKGSGVSMSGYRIGKVTGIQLREDMVYVHCYINDSNVHIRRNSTFTIAGEGLMGDKHVEIVPSRDYTAPYVANKEIIYGTTPMSLDQLVDQGHVLVQRLQELTSSAKDIIGDPVIKENTRAIFINARNSSDNIKEITDSIRGRSDHIIESLDKILKNVNSEIEKNRNDIKQIVENFRKISTDIDKITNGSRDNINTIIANLKATTDKLDNMIAKLNEGDKLTTDVKDTINSLKATSENAKEITREVKEIVVDKDVRAKLNTTLDDAHKLARAVDNVFVSIKQIRIELKYLLRYHKETEDFLSDLTLDVYKNPSSFFRLGIEDIGRENDVNAMIGLDADSKFIKRAGVIRSKVGIGFDYVLGKNLTLSADAIDTKKTELRLKAKFAFNDHVAFELRVDNATRDEEINFGLEYMF